MTVRVKESLVQPTAAPSGSWLLVGAGSVANQLAKELGDPALVRRDVVTSGLTALDGLALVPDVPPPSEFVTSSDLAARIKSPLAWLVRQLQAALPSMRGPASVAVLLPAEPTMAVSRSALPSAVCGGAMSMVRTWALELQRERIGVNCLMYERDGDDLVNATAVARQVQALWSVPVVTGQEMYLGAGVHLGRLRP